MENEIAVVEPVGGHGGLDFYDLGLCEAIAKTGFSVTLYTSDSTTLDQHIALSTRVRKVYRGAYGKASRMVRGIRYVVGVLRAVFDAWQRKTRLAHFHLFEFSWLELINILVFRLIRAKIVATVHDVDVLDRINDIRSQRRYQKFVPYVDMYLVHTDYAANALCKVLPEAKGRLEIVTHSDSDFVFGFDGDRMAARKMIGASTHEDDLLVLFFGQIKEVKGLDVLISAFSIVANSNSRAQLLIAGKAWRTDFEKFEKQIADLGLSERVIRHIRFIDNKDVPVYFKAADVVVLPYRKVYNSGVLLRAMDYGAAIIASDLEPFRQVISDGKNGVLFSSGDSDALAVQLNRVLSDESFMAELRHAAKKTIETHYSQEVIGQEMKRIYERVLEK